MTGPLGRPLLPAATYRLQLGPELTFRRVAELGEYFAELGISDLYLSPVLASREGSEHGYDVVDHERLHPSLGTEEDFGAMADALGRLGLGVLVDVVPNHMCIASAANRWWNDLLENGPASPCTPFFDIDWRPPKPELADKVLLPMLGENYGLALESRKIQVHVTPEGFTAGYYDLRFPLAPDTWGHILSPPLDALTRRLGAEAPEVLELESILRSLRQLPGRTAAFRDRIVERRREARAARARIDALAARCPAFAEALRETLEALNGRTGEPRSFDRLDALLNDQPYRLSHWRVAADEINYRRFFDVNTLAAIRVEDPEVFRSTHALLLRFIERGWIRGLRIDHVDGLLDPAAYLKTLQAAAAAARGLPAGDEPRPFYTVVEKILLGGERLSPEWACHGTTGYDFLNLLNGLFVDPASEAPLLTLYREFRSSAIDPADQLAICKKLILHVALASEVYVLAKRLDRISEQNRWSRDFTLESLRFGLRDTIGWFPAYRTYIRPDGSPPGEEDRRHVLRAIRQAKRHNPAVSATLFDFIRDVWLLESSPGLGAAQRKERLQFVLKLQQVTGPAMAKGLEDTLFYRHFPLASLNEVGAEARFPRVTLEEFHRRNRERRETWPHTLLATATHDTKRGEDLRARLNAVSEIPDAWAAAVRRWRIANRAFKSDLDGLEAPSPNDEYLLYQTLLGAWPPGLPPAAAQDGLQSRIEACMIKSTREAKVHTSWTNVSEPYEEALRRFIRAVMDPAHGFLQDFLGFLAPVLRAGVRSSLAQAVLKVACPGVPDLYQGTELWDLNLVDPDNRRPVDFELRRRLLASLPNPPCPEAVRALLEAPEDGRIKLHVLRAALGVRRSLSDVFSRGDYVPLAVSGPRAAHACVFARVLDRQAVLAASGRFFLQLEAAGPEPWKGTTAALPEPL
ncbi:MAG TPA: malto-oligosyltrehalose synthase, partial [Planctomycetota bacterium]|nr:malto-oligosyltrehalose synthase [Planctomycetota bacterium]